MRYRFVIIATVNFWFTMMTETCFQNESFESWLVEDLRLLNNCYLRYLIIRDSFASPHLTGAAVFSAPKAAFTPDTSIPDEQLVSGYKWIQSVNLV